MLFLTRLQQQSQRLAHKVALQMVGPDPAGHVTRLVTGFLTALHRIGLSGYLTFVTIHT